MELSSNKLILTSSSGQEENRNVFVLVELINKGLSLVYCSLPREHEIPYALHVEDNLEDLKDLGELM